MDKHQLRVLLVEDDEEDFMLTRDLLDDITVFECALQWAGSYAAAKEALSAKTFDVCLIDYRLGERTGLDLLRETIGEGCRTPMILLTGQDDRAVDLEAMKAGAADYLIKGRIDAGLLERTIRYALERKRGEDTLEEAAKRERAMIEKALDVICTIDAEGRFATINPACFRMWGYQPAELIGRPYIDLVAPEDVAKTNESTASNMSGEELTNFENRCLHKNGTVVNLMWTSHWSESEQLMFAVAHDISARKRVEQALFESTERELAVIKKALDVICTIDAEGRFATINPACFRMWGYEPSELIGRPYIDLVAPEDVAKTNESTANNMSGEELINFENRCLHKNGTVVNLMWTSHWSESEQLMFAVAHDISARIKAEGELRNFAAQLERSNSELQEFASVASHDLQEPLRKVQAFGERLKVKYGDTLNEDGRDYLERMQNAASRMQTLINDLLTFARVASNAQPFVPVDLRRLADSVLSDWKTLLETTNGTIEIGELATIEADPTQMRQLLENLVGNALKFNRPGVPPIIKISGQVCHNFAADYDETAAGVLSSACETYCMTIEDNGIGFEDKYVDRIFKVFQRLHGRSEYEGTGIGLAVCRRIAERHGGGIKAQSVAGEGTTFSVNLPIKQSEPIKIKNTSW